MSPLESHRLNDEVEHFVYQPIIPKRLQGMGGEMEFLAILANILDGQNKIAPEIFKRVPSYEKLIPIVMDCFDELGWGDQKLDDN